jgi:hypothetical protein
VNDDIEGIDGIKFIFKGDFTEQEKNIIKKEGVEYDPNTKKYVVDSQLIKDILDQKANNCG